MMSMPALQKAEIEVNTETQIPLAGPKRGMNSKQYSTAPSPSTSRVHLKILVRKDSRPRRLSRFSASSRRVLLRREKRRRRKSITMEMAVTIPRPPSWIRTRMIAWPNRLQWA